MSEPPEESLWNEDFGIIDWDGMKSSKPVSNLTIPVPKSLFVSELDNLDYQDKYYDSNTAQKANAITELKLSVHAFCTNSF